MINRLKSRFYRELKKRFFSIFSFDVFAQKNIWSILKSRQAAIALAAVIFLAGGYFILNHEDLAQATNVSGTITQSNWSGSASPSATTSLTGYTGYESKDSTITGTASQVGLTPTPHYEPEAIAPTDILPTADVRGYWNFDEVDGPTINDYSGVGSLTTTVVNGSGSRSIGYVGEHKSLQVSGSSTYAAVTNSYTTTQLRPTAALTVETWYRPSGSLVASALIDYSYPGGAGGQGGYVLSMLADGQVTFRTYAATNIYTVYSGATKLSVGNWYHLVGTFDGANLTLYINGIPVGQIVQAEPIAWNSSNYSVVQGPIYCNWIPFFGCWWQSPPPTYHYWGFTNHAAFRLNIGANYASGFSGLTVTYANGYIDNTAIYGRALTADEIKDSGNPDSWDDRYVNVVPTYTYETAGNLTSSAFDTAHSSQYGIIDYAVTDDLANSAITVSVAFSNDNSTWTGWTAASDGTNLATITGGTGYRYIKYKADFTGDASTTDLLTSISIPYNYERPDILFLTYSSSVNEGTDTEADFTISLSEPVANNVTVNFSLSGTANGTATLPNDYTYAATGSTIITAGQTSSTVQIPIINDALAEGDETIIMTLTSATSSSDVAILVAQRIHTVTIVDDNFTPQITSLSPSSASEGLSDTLVTIIGDNFIDGVSAVFVDGNPISSTFTDQQHLQINLLAATKVVPGVTISVINIGTTGEASMYFTVTPWPPTVDQFTQNVVTGDYVVVNGAHLYAGSTVTLVSSIQSWNTYTPTIIARSDEQIVFTAPAGYSYYSPYSIIVDTPGGQAVVTNSLTYTNPIYVTILKGYSDNPVSVTVGDRLGARLSYYDSPDYNAILNFTSSVDGVVHDSESIAVSRSGLNQSFEGSNGPYVYLFDGSAVNDDAHLEVQEGDTITLSYASSGGHTGVFAQTGYSGGASATSVTVANPATEYTAASNLYFTSTGITLGRDAALGSSQAVNLSFNSNGDDYVYTLGDGVGGSIILFAADNSGIYGQRYNADQEPQWNGGVPLLLVDTGSGTKFSFVVDGSYFYVAETHAEAGDAPGGGVYKFDLFGAQQWANTNVNPVILPGNSSIVRSTYFGNGVVVVDQSYNNRLIGINGSESTIGSSFGQNVKIYTYNTLPLYVVGDAGSNSISVYRDGYSVLTTISDVDVASGFNIYNADIYGYNQLITWRELSTGKAKLAMGWYGYLSNQITLSDTVLVQQGSAPEAIWDSTSDKVFVAWNNSAGTSAVQRLTMNTTSLDFTIPPTLPLVINSKIGRSLRPDGDGGLYVFGGTCVGVCGSSEARFSRIDYYGNLQYSPNGYINAGGVGGGNNFIVGNYNNGLSDDITLFYQADFGTSGRYFVRNAASAYSSNPGYLETTVFDSGADATVWTNFNAAITRPGSTHFSYSFSSDVPGLASFGSTVDDQASTATLPGITGGRRYMRAKITLTPDSGDSTISPEMGYFVFQNSGPLTDSAMTAFVAPLPDGTIVLGADSGFVTTSSMLVGDTVYIRLSDLALNTDALAAETLNVLAKCTSGDQVDGIVLTETNIDTGVFEGSVVTSTDAVVAADPTLQCLSVDTVSVMPYLTSSNLIDSFNYTTDGNLQSNWQELFTSDAKVVRGTDHVDSTANTIFLNKTIDKSANLQGMALLADFTGRSVTSQQSIIFDLKQSDKSSFYSGETSFISGPYTLLGSKLRLVLLSSSNAGTAYVDLDPTTFVDNTWQTLVVPRSSFINSSPTYQPFALFPEAINWNGVTNMFLMAVVGNGTTVANPAVPTLDVAIDNVGYVYYDTIYATGPDTGILRRPNGGETFTYDSTQDILEPIVWDATAVGTGDAESNNVLIEYSTDDFATFTEVESSYPNTGRYYWSVPNIDSDTVRVRVTEVANPTNTDFSILPFSIHPGDVKSYDFSIPAEYDFDPDKLDLHSNGTDFVQLKVAGPGISSTDSSLTFTNPDFYDYSDRPSLDISGGVISLGVGQTITTPIIPVGFMSRDIAVAAAGGSRVDYIDYTPNPDPEVAGTYSQLYYETYQSLNSEHFGLRPTSTALDRYGNIWVSDFNPQRVNPNVTLYLCSNDSGVVCTTDSDCNPQCIDGSCNSGEFQGSSCTYDYDCPASYGYGYGGGSGTCNLSVGADPQYVSKIIRFGRGAGFPAKTTYDISIPAIGIALDADNNAWYGGYGGFGCVGETCPMDGVSVQGQIMAIGFDSNNNLWLSGEGTVCLTATSRYASQCAGSPLNLGVVSLAPDSQGNIWGVNPNTADDKIIKFYFDPNLGAEGQYTYRSFQYTVEEVRNFCSNNSSTSCTVDTVVNDCGGTPVCNLSTPYCTINYGSCATDNECSSNTCFNNSCSLTGYWCSDDSGCQANTCYISGSGNCSNNYNYCTTDVDCGGSAPTCDAIQQTIAYPQTPYGIAVDDSDNVWVTDPEVAGQEPTGTKVYCLTAQGQPCVGSNFDQVTGSIVVDPNPTLPLAISVDQANRVWVTTVLDNKIHCLDPENNYSSCGSYNIGAQLERGGEGGISYNNGDMTGRKQAMILPATEDRSTRLTTAQTVTTTDLSQINTSDWYSLDGFTFTGTNEGTLKFLVSFDGRQTWWGKNIGGEWSEPTGALLADKLVGGMTVADLQVASFSPPGFEPGTLDVAVLMKSNLTGELNPQLDAISINYTLADFGTVLSTDPIGAIPTIEPKVVFGDANAVLFTDLIGFSEIKGENHAETADIRYQLSPNGADWYFHNGTSWVTPPAATFVSELPTIANTSEEVNANLATFASDLLPAVIDTLYFRSFLRSGSLAQLEAVNIGYNASAITPPPPHATVILPLSAPTLISAQPLCDDATGMSCNGGHFIRWTFDDNSINETGFKLIGPDGLERISQFTADLCRHPATETGECILEFSGLTPNAEYAGYYLLAYNSDTTSRLDLPSVFTLANKSISPTVTSINDTTINIKVNLNGNSPTTEFAIQVSYIDANGNVVSQCIVDISGTLGDCSSSAYQSYSLFWGGASGFNLGNLTKDRQYTFSVSARNGDGVVTAYSQSTLGTPGVPVAGTVTLRKGVLVIHADTTVLAATVSSGIEKYKTQFETGLIALRSADNLQTIFNFMLAAMILLFLISVITIFRSLEGAGVEGSKFAMLPSILSKEASEFFGDYSSKLPDGTYEYSFAHHKRLHRLSRTSLFSSAGLLAAKIVLIIVIALFGAQLHRSIAQAKYCYEDICESAKPGDTLSYILTWDNPTENEIKPAAITDSLAKVVSYTSFSAVQTGTVTFAAEPTMSDHTLTFNLGSIPPHSSGSVIFNVLVSQDTVVTNQAFLNGVSDGVTASMVGDVISVQSNTVKTPIAVVTCTEDTWTCGEYGACQPDNTQSRTCVLTDCPTAATPDEPAVQRACVYELPVVEPPVITEPPVIKPPVIKPPVIKPPVTEPPVLPTQPTEPGEPTTPIIPVEPAQPTESTEPTEPGQQTEPVEVGGALTRLDNYVDSILPFLHNPKVEKAAEQVVVPAFLGFAAALTLPSLIAGAFNVLPYLHMIFMEPLYALFGKRRQKYGAIYNALTKLPVDLAVIRVYDAKTKKLVTTKISDKQGRFYILAPVGSYYLAVTKPGFIYPTVYLKDDKEDANFTDVYHGEKVEVTQDGTPITVNIPLDPKDKVMSQEKLEVRRFLYGKFKSFLPVFGIVLSAIGLIIYPTPLMFGYLLLHMTLFMMMKRVVAQRRPKSWGVVSDEKSGAKLKHAVVRIFDSRFNKLLETYVTDSSGRYNFLVGPNSYQVVGSKEGYLEHQTKQLDMTKVKTQEAVVAEDFGLKRGDEAGHNQPGKSDGISPSRGKNEGGTSNPEMHIEKEAEVSEPAKKHEEIIDPTKTGGIDLGNL